MTLTVRDNNLHPVIYNKIIFDQSNPTTLNESTLKSGLNEMGKGHHHVSSKAGESVKQFLHHFILMLSSSFNWGFPTLVNDEIRT